MNGTYNGHAGQIAPPVDDSQLLSVAESGGYHYTGKTTIVLTGSTMTVTNALINGGAPQSGVALPTNGVIYVSTATAGCSVNYTPFNPSYSNDANCGNVYVSGTYNSSLTIATDNDIIIDGNLCNSGAACTTSLPAPTGNAVLGLIANDFVRIYHPVSGSRGSSAGSCSAGYGGNVTNGTGSLYNPIIYAAILAVNHSFIVDNYDCGGESPALGTLYVYGAIAQLFRGPVGTGGSGGATSGYLKSYNYDDRLVRGGAAVLPRPGLGRLVRLARDRVRRLVRGLLEAARRSAPGERRALARRMQTASERPQRASALARERHVELLDDALEGRARDDDIGGERLRELIAGGRVALVGGRLERGQRVGERRRAERRGARAHAVGVARERLVLAALGRRLDLARLRVELLEEQAHDPKQRLGPAEIVLERGERLAVDAPVGRRPRSRRRRPRSRRRRCRRRDSRRRLARSHSRAPRASPAWPRSRPCRTRGSVRSPRASRLR